MAADQVSFSVYAGDNPVLAFSTALGRQIYEGAVQVEWSLYAQSNGVPSGDAILVKELDYGVTVAEDGESLSFSVELEMSDTQDLSGNYYHEARVVDQQGKNLTVAVGYLTVIARGSLSPDVIRLRFPELSSVSDAALAFAIAEAIVRVGDSWIEVDRVPAASLLAAHLVSQAAESARRNGRVVTSESISHVSRTYSVGSATSAQYGSTSYGLQYLELMRRSFPSVISL